LSISQRKVKVGIVGCAPDTFMGAGIQTSRRLIENAGSGGRSHRASSELAYLVLDVMRAFHDAGRKGRYVELQGTRERPAPLPMDLRPGTVD